MSVQLRPDGTSIARWRPAHGPRGKDGKVLQKSKVFPKGQNALALAFDAEMKVKQFRGAVGSLATATMRMDELAVEWFEVYAKGNLERATLESYAYLWDAFLLSRVGALTLNKATRPAVWMRVREDLEKAGVGPATIRRLMGMVQAMFREAVLWDYVDSNPLKLVPKPPRGRKRAIAPVAPLRVEIMRQLLLDEDRVFDALLVCLVHYAGLRPGEALALVWERVLKNTLVIDAAIALGDEKETKNERNRSVDLLAPLRADLDRARLASGRQGGLLFPTAATRTPRNPRSTRYGVPGRPNPRAGRPWSKPMYDDWREFTYAETARRAGFVGTPYNGRHSFASLLLHAGETTAWVAEQLGDTITTVEQNYLHVIKELRGEPARPSVDVIREARAHVAERGVHQVCTELKAKGAAGS